jgi:hypothetical protein
MALPIVMRFTPVSIAATEPEVGLMNGRPDFTACLCEPNHDQAARNGTQPMPVLALTVIQSSLSDVHSNRATTALGAMSDFS